MKKRSHLLLAFTLSTAPLIVGCTSTRVSENGTQISRTHIGLLATPETIEDRRDVAAATLLENLERNGAPANSLLARSALNQLSSDYARALQELRAASPTP